MNIDRLRYFIASWRWWYFVKVRKQFRSVNAIDASANTVSHNIAGMKDLAVRRSLVLIRPLAAVLSISRPGQPIEADTFRGIRVLSVGPRTEGELLNLVAYGFEPHNIRGLDLISYSPWVDVGDMHSMPYPDSCWDAIVLGWVLAYSDNKQQAADEIIRIARNGAIVAVGVEYCCLSNEQLSARLGYLPGSSERIWSLADITKYFEGHIGTMYFSHDVSPERCSEEVVALVAVFSIKK